MDKQGDVVLEARRVLFYSPGDEAAFFARLDSLKLQYSGQKDALLISVKRPISDVALRELIALSQRYSLEMRQLSHLLTSRNRSWFKNPKARWFRDVFARPRQTRRTRLL